MKVTTTLYLVHCTDGSVQILGKIQKEDKIIMIGSDMADCKRRGYVYFYVSCIDQTTWKSGWDSHVTTFKELSSIEKLYNESTEIAEEAFTNPEAALEFLMNSVEFRKNWTDLCSKIFVEVEKEMA